MSKLWSNKSWFYVSMMNYECANPECKYGYNIEGHHITPLSCGGDDAYWNLICLCKRCHAKFRKSSHLGTSRLELYVWKSMQELTLHGFTLDEYDDDFPAKLREMRKSNIMELQ